MLHLGLLLVCAVVIYLACELFVNAVEWLGVRLRVGPVAVGTVLAAAGTALPESVVTLVAVTTGDAARGAEVGVGAALGGPLVVGTIAYGVAGAVLLLVQRRHRLAGTTPRGGLDEVDAPRLARDQAWFLAIFVVKLGLGLVAFSWKPWLGVAFLAAYAVYFWQEVRGDGSEASSEDLEPLRLQPRREHPATWAVLAQTLATLVVVFVASQVFVGQLEAVAPFLGLPQAVVALLLAPVATELPEVMNAVIWVRQGKLQLALANVSGSMMIQATVPSALGLFFTPWDLDAPLLVAGGCTLLAVAYLLVLLRTRRLTPVLLAGAAGFYVLFAVCLLAVA